MEEIMYTISIGSLEIEMWYIQLAFLIGGILFAFYLLFKFLKLCDDCSKIKKELAEKIDKLEC
jgi:TRAP-type C4-dicarboxylate transport system permease small subunit